MAKTPSRRVSLSFQLQREHDSREPEQETERSHFFFNAKQHTSELGVAQGYERSKPILSDVFPPARPHYGPKQPHQLGTYYSNYLSL